jgi:hypothetical protein
VVSVRKHFSGGRDRCPLSSGISIRFVVDFNPGRQLNITEARRELGTLHRNMFYADLYAVLANETTFTRVVAAGWFPFIEIMTSEFKSLSSACEAGC